MVSAFIAILLCVGAEPDGTASSAVLAYIETSAAQREDRIRQMQTLFRQRGSSAGLSSAEKKRRAAELKSMREFAKRLADPNDFVPPTILPPDLSVGYCGRIGHLFYRPGEQPESRAKVVQVVDESNCIVKAAGAWYWIKGISTAKLVDDNAVSLNGAWYVPKNTTYTTVAGGSNTILVLERFDEAQALPHLTDSQAAGLKTFLEDKNPPKR